MGKHFMAALGTSSYSNARYQFVRCDDCRSSESCNARDVEGRPGCEHVRESRFIQAAACSYSKDEIDRATVFLTSGAEERNWGDAEPIPTESAPATKTSLSIRLLQYLAARCLKKSRSSSIDLPNGGTVHAASPPRPRPETGLESELKAILGEDKVEGIPIPEGKTQAQIWEIFEKVYDSIEDNEEIVFDLTHSFRSLPLLAVAVLVYARVLKGCKVSAIIYGAYDGREDGAGVAPVFDMLPFIDIMDWTHAAESFERTGSVAEMRKLLERQASTPGHTAAPFDSMVDAIGCVSDNLMSCRGAGEASVSNLTDKDRRSIQASAKELMRTSEDMQRQIKGGGWDQGLVPLAHLIEYSSGEYAPFANDDSVAVGIEAVEWYVGHGMIPQGYIALEELGISHLCKGAGYNPEEPRDRDLINAIIMVRGNHTKGMSEDDFFAELGNMLPGRIMPSRGTPEGEKAWEAFETMKIDLACEVNRLRSSRNTIGHFGLKLRGGTLPERSNALEDKLKASYELIREIIYGPRVVDGRKTYVLRWLNDGYDGKRYANFKDERGRILSCPAEKLEERKGGEARKGDRYAFETYREEAKSGQPYRISWKTIEYMG